MNYGRQKPHPDIQPAHKFSNPADVPLLAFTSPIAISTVTVSDQDTRFPVISIFPSDYCGRSENRSKRKQGS